MPDFNCLDTTTGLSDDIYDRSEISAWLLPARLAGFSYRSQRGAQTKAAVAFESAGHLILTLTSQVWPTITRPGSQSPALFVRVAPLGSADVNCDPSALRY